MSSGLQLFVLAYIVSCATLAARSAAGAADWPILLQNTITPGLTTQKSTIIKPHLAWSHHLGYGRVEALRDGRRQDEPALDLNGDGRSEKIECEYGSRRFDVHDGADGRILWSATTEQEILERLFSVADVDADGDPDLCLVTHYRAEVFDGATGTRICKIPWDVGRNYGLNRWINIDDDPQLECVILSDYTAHVDVLDTGPNGASRHLWSSVYRLDKDENAPIDFKRGRRDLRYLYRSASDLDGDGRPELAYMVFNLADRREWRTLIRKLPGGEPIAELENQFVYGIEDVDGEAGAELLAARLPSYGMRGFAPLSIWKLKQGAAQQIADLGLGRFVLAADPLPLHAAVNGQNLTEQSTVAALDFNRDGRKELLIERDRSRDGVADEYEAIQCRPDAKPERTLHFPDPEQCYVFESIAEEAGVLELQGYDVRNVDALKFLANGTVKRNPSPRSWSFTSDPVAGDIDGDGACEFVAQTPDGWIQVFQDRRPAAPKLLWKRRGWGMNEHQGYTRPARGVVLANLDGDGKAEVIFASVNSDGLATLTVADRQGKTVWEHAIPGVTPDWPDSGIDQWCVGDFNGDRTLDLLVQYHDLGHSSGKLFALDGRTKQRMWHRIEVSLEGLVRPMCTANFLVADFDHDGADDVGMMPSNGFAALSGNDGSPIASVRFYPPHPEDPDRWRPKDSDAPYGARIAAHDTDGDGTPEVFFNDRLTQAALRIAPAPAKMWVTGEPHTDKAPVQFRAEDNALLVDLDHDGSMEFCAFHAENRLVIHNAKTGEVLGECRLPATPTSQAVAADIDGDGKTDLIFGAGNKLIAVTIPTLRPTRARELWSYDFAAPVGTPAIADLDHDGNADIIVPTADAQLHCLSGQPK